MGPWCRAVAREKLVEAVGVGMVEQEAREWNLKAEGEL